VLERVLGTQVRHHVVLEVDLVRDITVVDVRSTPGRPAGSPAARRLERVAS
jgi:hypothetical protein